MAKLPHVHGVFQAMMAYLEGITDNIRIDTHKDNHIMQHNLSKYGFTYCGIIYIASGPSALLSNGFDSPPLATHNALFTEKCVIAYIPM